MQTRSLLGESLIAALLWEPAVRAHTPVRVQNEVNFLLGCVAGSGGEFYRNGSWHDAHEAHVHLRDKYKYLLDNNRVGTTEQFIDRAASQSSFSGNPYQIRCRGAAAVNSRQWLHERLRELRVVQ